MRIDNPTFAPGGLNTVTNATTAASATSVTQASQLWVQTNSYVAGALVHRDSIIYRANGAVPANTSFAVGTTGATWTLIGSSGIPTWTNAGTITTFPATTTAGSISAWSRNGHLYRQVGAKAWEINVVLDKGTGGSAVNGNGDYLFSLPAACPDMDINQTFQNTYTGGVGASEPILSRFMIPTSNGFANHNVTITSDVAIVPWSARQYRIVLHVTGTAIRCWGSNWFPLDGAFGVTLFFGYQSV